MERFASPAPMAGSEPSLDAFEAVYRDESPYVAALLVRLGLDRGRVPDVTQEVFITAFRRWADYDSERPIRAWLYGIARRVAFRDRRGHARHARKLGALSESTRHPPRFDAEPSVAQAKLLLHQLVDELAPEVAEVFLLADFGGYTAKEISERTGLSTDAVYYRLRSARAHLRTCLEDSPEAAEARHRALVPAWGLLATELGAPSAATPAGLGLGAKIAAALGKASLAAKLGIATLTVAGGLWALDAGAKDDPAEHPALVSSETARVDPIAPTPATSRTPPSEPALTPPQASTPGDAPAHRAAALPKAAIPKVASTALAAETELIEAAQRATRSGDPNSALRWLDQHAAEFPEGQLATARRRARIVALCASGQRAAARGSARVWAEQSPRDPLALQSIDLCPRDDAQNSAEAEKK